MVGMYNLLPRDAADAGTVSLFQSKLQKKLVRDRAASGCADWRVTFLPRIAMEAHPVR